jgi:uncharacterized membrane protein
MFSVLLLSGFIPAEVDAQTDNILMANTTIQNSMLANGTTIIDYSSTIINRGVTEIDQFECRVDVRTLAFFQDRVGSEISSISITPANTFNLITVHLTSPLLPAASIEVSFSFKTDEIQEQYGICPDTGLCLHNMIFYVRPSYEIRNFTFIAKLPIHSVLADERSPLFPDADSNFTDGNTLGFTWFSNQILPGQERVYIVKYGHPVTPQIPDDVPADMTLMIVLSLLSGAMLAIILERFPKVLTKLRKEERPLVVGITSHENEVLRLLKRKGGSCPQRLIYEELDMSQSLASMVLTGLEERGLIKRLRDGRENVVHIIED